MRTLLICLLCTVTLAAMDADEYAKALRLIELVKTKTDHTFTRNGATHGVGAAATLMRRKLDDQRDSLRTVADYIDACVTKSSTSGREYQIVDPAGNARPSAVVLREWYATLIEAGR